jgi:diamine N-acetyltransferase
VTVPTDGDAGPQRTEPPGDIRFRPTRSDDIDFVLDLEARPETSPYIAHWTREEHQQSIDKADDAHWILEDAGVPVGYMILRQVRGERVELRRIVIGNAGRGYGRFALREAKRVVFEEWGAAVLWLDVFDFNDRAKALYESEGWVTVGSRPAAEACGVEEGTALLMEVGR